MQTPFGAGKHEALHRISIRFFSQMMAVIIYKSNTHGTGTQDLRCALGSYTYGSKLVANLLAPIALLLVVYGVRALRPTTPPIKTFMAAKAFRVASFVVFLFCASALARIGPTQSSHVAIWLAPERMTEAVSGRL